ncbi:GAF domain-containing protein [Microbacterium sp. AG1240]|uniref:GAF and ANTAR domain-containing protein n=1 Tax=Microbacterium sp. AG1240 TaxID=2183992 RepID=UPI000EAF13C6|nr:GAF and ANTAR domain-containing protein [Microbacterium sp. AG1240]RKT36864.1 GAF domain-containing protein [Microbacterium sp. AG1240]
MATREEHLLRTATKLSDSLDAQFDIARLLQLLVDDCTELFDANAAGVLLATPGVGWQVSASTSERSELVGLLQCRVGEGPSVEAALTGDVVSVPDLRHITDTWPRFAVDAHRSGYASLYAIPMRLRGAVVGSLTLFRDQTGDLNHADATAAKTLADIATISVLQSRRTEESAMAQRQLQRALDSRVVIEQAKGYVAFSHDIDMDAAFRLLRMHARSTQTPISAVAAEVIAGRLTLQRDQGC